jgi:hypothetical protein
LRLYRFALQAPRGFYTASAMSGHTLVRSGRRSIVGLRSVDKVIQ